MTMFEKRENTEIRESLDVSGLIAEKAIHEEGFIADTSVSPLHLECSNSAEIHINPAESHLQTKIPVPSIIEVVVKESRSKEHNPSMAGSLFAEHKLADKMTEILKKIAPVVGIKPANQANQASLCLTNVRNKGLIMKIPTPNIMNTLNSWSYPIINRGLV